MEEEPENRTLPPEGDSKNQEAVEMEEDNKEVNDRQAVKKPRQRRVYLPGAPLRQDEELIHDPTAYVMLHGCNTGYPCLSFDVIPDHYGDNREAFPLTAYYVAGTQADKAHKNNLLIMKVSNLRKTLENKEDSESDSDSDSDSDEEMGATATAVLETAFIKHNGTINRVRCNKIDDKVYAAAWSEEGKVTIFSLNNALDHVNSPPTRQFIKGKRMTDTSSSLFSFGGHLTEGYAIDWSGMTPGVLASGDCNKNIHIWKPLNSTWHVDQRPLTGHNDSVEDLQWSPNEPSVLASCSVDKSLRIWDTREKGTTACKLVVEGAHDADVNVISWNKKDPLILSGGDDGIIRVWDLRQFKKGSAVATLKHHISPVTSIEWSPVDSSVFASSGSEDQVAVWDLAAERDPDDITEQAEELKDLPQQLLFIHQGQSDIKEIHWHRQIPGLITSTAATGFNFFIPISI